MDLLCPQCHSKAYKRNGFTRHGKQNHRCRECGKQFSAEPIEAQENNDDIVFIVTVDECSTI
jgi:transposase-like protein